MADGGAIGIRHQGGEASLEFDRFATGDGDGDDAAGGVLTLSFGLPAGGYATTVLRELFDTGYVAEDGG